MIIQNEMQQEIEAADGMFKTGIYNLDIDINNVAEVGNAFVKGMADTPFLHTVFPFHPSVYDMIVTMVDTFDAERYEARRLADDVVKRKPKLHFKSQFFLSEQVVSTILPLAAWRAVIKDYISALVEQTRRRDTPADVKDLRAALSESAAILAESWRERATPEEMEKVIVYLSIGSQNQDYRGKITDGEVLVVVSRQQAMAAFLDFVGIMGTTTWVENVDQLEKLLPRYGGFWYRVSRFMKLAL